MAICRVCKQEMLCADGCIGEYVRIGQKRYKRIRVGEEGDFFEGADANDDVRCGDCGAKLGGLHHWGCDCERCPKCMGQMISCDCVNGKGYVLLV